MRRILVPLLACAMLLGACRGGTGVRLAPTPEPITQPANLSAFRYTLAAEASNLAGAPAAVPGGTPTPITVRVSGEVAAADRQRSHLSLNLGFGVLESDRVQIGDRTWTRDGIAPWVEERTVPDAAATRALGLGLDPAVLVGAAAQDRLKAALKGGTATTEHANGIDVARYTLTAAQVRTLLGTREGSQAASLAGGTDAWSFWVTKDRWLPVRLLADAPTEQGGHIRVDLALTDHNVPGIAVEPPK